MYKIITLSSILIFFHTTVLAKDIKPLSKQQVKKQLSQKNTQHIQSDLTQLENYQQNIAPIKNKGELDTAHLLDFYSYSQTIEKLNSLKQALEKMNQELDKLPLKSEEVFTIVQIHKQINKIEISIIDERANEFSIINNMEPYLNNPEYNRKVIQQGHLLEASLNKIDTLVKQKEQITEKLILILNTIWKNESDKK